MRKEDFEFHQPGMTHLFTVKDKRCQLYIPEGFVLDEAADVNGRQQKPPPLPTPPPPTNLPIGKSRPDDKAALAQEVGMSEEEVLAHVAEEEELLKEAAVQKGKQQAAAILDESIDLNKQQEALREFEREKKKEKAQRREGSGGGLQRGDPLPAPVDNHFMPEGLGHPRGQLGGGQNFNRQHSWQHPTSKSHIYDELPDYQRRGSEDVVAPHLDPLHHQANPRGNPPDPRGNLPDPRGNLPDPRGNPPDPRGNLPDPRGNPPDPRGNPPDPRGNPPDPRGNLPDTRHYPVQPQVPTQQSYAHQGSVHQPHPTSGYPPPTHPRQPPPLDRYGEGSPESRRQQQPPLAHISENERLPLQHQSQPMAFTNHPEKPDHPPLLHQFSIGSTVQLSDPPRYGVIRWIGELREIQGLVAGMELVI